MLVCNAYTLTKLSVQSRTGTNENIKADEMKPSDFIKKLMSRYLVGNLLAMALVVAVACGGVKYGIDRYTHHGEEIAIPDVKHKLYGDAEYLLTQAGLQVQVTDTGYVRSLPPGCILEQNPAAWEKVKSGHIIYVIVNASHTPTITVPDIVDNSSLREAMAKLSAMGFKLTQPEYVPGEKDWVYGLRAGTRHVATGDKVSVNDALTILVGNGQVGDDESIDYVDAPVIDMEEEGATDDFHEVTAPPPGEE